jgi:Zn-dependent protease
MSFRDFRDKAQRYARFSSIEWREFWLAGIILALILSWNEWGSVEFDFWVGAANVLIGLVMASIALYVHHMAQRLWAVKEGLKVEHKLWLYGAGIGAVTMILTRGAFSMLGVTGTYITPLDVHRLGRYRYGAQMKQIAMVTLMGPLAVLIVAGFVKSLALYTSLPLPTALVDRFFIFMIAFAAWNLLPIPPLDGSRIIYSSRLLYAFVAGGVVGYTLLIMFGGVYSWVWGLAIGAFTWLMFYIILERSWA